MQRITPEGRKHRGVGRGTALLALAACLLIPAMSAQAQDKDAGSNGGDTTAKTGATPAGTADKHVSLDADNMKLTEALPPLMKSAGADFVVDNALKGVTVSVHLDNVRFQVALDTLVKVCSEPVTYKLVDGVYHFIPRVDPPEAPKGAPKPSWPHGPSYAIGKIMVQNSDAQELVDFLTGNGNGLNSAPDSLSINGDISGFRSYSSSGFNRNGPFGSGYSSPITNNNNSGFGNGSSTRSGIGGGSISFGPIGLGSGGITIGGHRIGGGR